MDKATTVVSSLWKERKWALLYTTLISFFFLLFAPYAIYFFYKNHNLFSIFNNIYGNSYKINALLLVLIIASYIIVLWESIRYKRSIFKEITSYKGENKKIQNYHTWAFYIIEINIISVSLYLLYIFLCCVIENKYLSFEWIILVNQRLTVSIFLFYVIADSFILRSQKILLQDNLQKEDNIKDSAFKKKQEKQDKYNNNINFTTQSLYLIGVPTLCIAALNLILQSFIKNKSILYICLKKTDTNVSEIPPLTHEQSRLFLDGLETGILVSILLISQIMFIFIEIYWLYEELKIAKKYTNEK